MRTVENGILQANKDTIEKLHIEHPKGVDIKMDMILHGPTKNVNPIKYEEITSDLIKKMAIKVKGTSGPLNMDADQWFSILGSSVFGQQSVTWLKR